MRKRRVLLAAFIIFMGNIQAYSNPSTPSFQVSTDSGIALEVLSGPVNKELVISFTEASAGSTVTITDLKGTKVLSQGVEPGANKATINVTKLTAGTYFVVLTNGAGRTSKLFVKQ